MERDIEKERKLVIDQIRAHYAPEVDAKKRQIDEMQNNFKAMEYAANSAMYKRAHTPILDIGKRMSLHKDAKQIERKMKTLEREIDRAIDSLSRLREERDKKIDTLLQEHGLA